MQVMKLRQSCPEFQLSHYPSHGSQYVRHRDAFPDDGSDEQQRKVWHPSRHTPFASCIYLKLHETQTGQRAHKLMYSSRCPSRHAIALAIRLSKAPRLQSCFA